MKKRTETFDYTLKLLTVLVFVTVRGDNQSDPCLSARRLPFLSIRTSNYKSDISGGEQYICDRDIIPQEGQWYSVDVYNISNSASGTFTCGTKYPIWSNGTLPKIYNEQVTMPACIPGIGSSCDENVEVKVKNCGAYNVYFLQRPHSCPASYCFGDGDIGPRPTSKVNKPNITFIMKRKINPRIDTEQLELVCNFVHLGNNEQYLYQVVWFVDGEMKSSTLPEKFSSINNTNLIGQQNGSFNKVGVDVTCGVRVRFTQRGLSGDLSTLSDPFFVGVKVTKAVSNDNMGGMTSISLQPTVPIGCGYLTKQSDKIAPCYIVFEISTPNASGNCSGLVPTQGSSDCEFTILSTKWNREHVFNISWLDENLGSDEHYFIRFRTQRHILQEIWSNYYLPDIQINSIQKGTNDGSHCMVSGYTILKTDYVKAGLEINGTYVIYKINEDGGSRQLEVQMLVQSRDYSSLLTTGYACGVAVRAGGDVYSFDRCTGGSNLFGFKTCKDNTLNVIKVNDILYKIYFPSGTYVTLDMKESSYIAIYIYPVSQELLKLEGMCKGIYDRETGQFQQRNIAVDQILKANRVSTEKDIFKMNHRTLDQYGRWEHTKHFCTCPSRGIDPALEMSCSRASSMSCSTVGQIDEKQKCSVKESA